MQFLHIEFDGQSELFVLPEFQGDQKYCCTNSLLQKEIDTLKLTSNLFRGFRLLLWEIKRVSFGKKHTASIDITDSCNLRCAHCYHFLNKDQLQDEVPLEIWRDRFRQLYRSGIRCVTLLGGEPALRLDVLKSANEIFPLVDVITNGTIRIPDDFGHRIYLSIEGAPETNDRIRGKGVFSQIIENYGGDSRIVVITTLNRMNYRALEEIVLLSKENNFSGVVCGLYSTPMNSEDPERLSLQDREVILDEVKRVRSKYPETLRMTDPMLRWYEKADHTSEPCYCRDQMLHFDVSFSRKKCFGLGNCFNCGCLAGASQNPLKKFEHPFEAVKTFLSLR
jgi:MoaA/NifB/PqqE/SkfB family radical SAM enzyme